MALFLVLLISLWIPPSHPDLTISSIQGVESIRKHSSEMFSPLILSSKPNSHTSTKPYPSPQAFLSFSSSPKFLAFFCFLLLSITTAAGLTGYIVAHYKKEEGGKDFSPVSPASICSTSLPSACSPKVLDLSDTSIGPFLWNEISEGLADNGSYSRNFEELGLLWKSANETVYLAKHKLDTEDYLIKTIPFSISLDSHIKDSPLFQTINKIKKLSLRHIARYVTCWVEDKPFELLSSHHNLTLYVQMEYIQGESLKTFLQSPLPKPTGLKILRQVCKIINYLHSQGLPHGDLSLDNIFLTKYNSVMIGDFNMNNCFCDDHRSVLELIKVIVQRTGDAESMLPAILQNKFIQTSGLAEQVVYLVRNS